MTNTVISDTDTLTVIGYIYILYCKYYGNRIKIGSTMDISRRKWDYITSLPKDPYYYTYYEILSDEKDKHSFPSNGKRNGDNTPSLSNNKSDILNIEFTIHKNEWFKSNNSRREFYKLSKEGDLHTKIKPYVNNISYVLNNMGLKFRVITKDNIKTRPKNTKYKESSRIYEELMEKYGEEDMIKTMSDKEKIFTLRPYQEKGVKLMNSNNIGKFILPTGTGKTIIFLSYLSTLKKSLVLVPYLDLIYQTCDKAKLFSFTKIVKICEGKLIKIILDRERENDRVLYIATYQSSDKEKYTYLSKHFDCIIFDEVQHTVIQNNNEQSSFQHILKNGKSDKKYYLTATGKNIKRTDKNIISMNNEEIYGETLLNMSLDEAIQNKYLTDYNIILWLNKTKNNKLNSIQNIIKETSGKKILIFCKDIKTIKSVNTHIKANSNFYCNYITGDTSIKDRKEILLEFKKADTSILVLCAVFKVGFDMDCIDTIIHYDRCSSPIDFIQKNGRCTRLCKGKNMSNIVIFTTIGEKDRDIRYYKFIFNSLSEYDYRIADKLKALKEDTVNKVYNTIKIKYNEEEEIDNVYEIYDRYMNYLSRSRDDIIIKFKLLIEFFKEYKRYPNCEETFEGKYEPLNIFSDKFKYNFINKIMKKEEPESYKKYREEFESILEREGVFQFFIDKKKKEDIIIEKFKLLLEFIKEYNRYPRDEEPFTGRYISLGSFPSELRKGFINKIINNKPITAYKSYKDYFEPMLIEINMFKSFKYKSNNMIIVKFDLLIEFFREYKRYPVKNEKYTDKYKILGVFPINLRKRFINKVNSNTPITGYISYKEHFEPILRKEGILKYVMNN